MSCQVKFIVALFDRGGDWWGYCLVDDGKLPETEVIVCLNRFWFMVDLLIAYLANSTLINVNILKVNEFNTGAYIGYLNWLIAINFVFVNKAYYV